VLYYSPRKWCSGRLCREDIVVKKGKSLYYITLWVPKDSKKVSKIHALVEPVSVLEVATTAVGEKLRRVTKKIALRKFLSKELGI